MSAAAEVPEQSWTNPFSEGQPLYRKFDKIVRDQRDIIILIDDLKGRRGTGKTVLSLALANALDQTDEGLTWDKVSLRPEEIRNAYADHPRRSGLVLDEGEYGIGNRDAMTGTNKALREIMSMGRVEEKYLIINTPLRRFIDKDIQMLCDVWISMQSKGRGLVHFYDYETYSGNLLTPKKQYLNFNDIPRGGQLREVYNKLTREKRKIIRGETGSTYVTEGEVEGRLEKAREEARKDQRDDLIRELYHHPDLELTQERIGEVVGLSQRAVSHILDE